MSSYRNLIVWQKSIELSIEVYNLVKLLPKEEVYALSDQMRRAVISIPSNIAEGQSRKNPNEFIHFLHIAKGSKSELETQLIICNQINYLTSAQTEKALALCDEIGKMIVALIDQIAEK